MKLLSLLLICFILFTGCIGVRIYYVTIENAENATTEFSLDMDLTLDKKIDAGLEVDPSILPFP